MGIDRRLAVRLATRRHYANNKEQYRVRNRMQAARKAEFIRKQREVPCADCGIQYPYYIMEFDHKNPEEKEFSISNMATMGWARIRKELEKCEVVCANCHTARTHFRRIQASVVQSVETTASEAV